MMNVGIICEGSTDYIILKEIIDKITEEDNNYFLLQPEADLIGKNGNGWKGVWKWCMDHSAIKEKFMKEAEPVLDILVIQMDGDVSRKEKEVHCWCESTVCRNKGVSNPIECITSDESRDACPVILPCSDHENSINGHMLHLENLIGRLLKDLKDTCIVIPCDSTESWIVAAYDEIEKVEEIENPWINVISKKKTYHNIKVSGTQKRQKLFKQFAEMVCLKWGKVTELCISAKKFEDNIILLHKKYKEEHIV